MIGSAIRDGDRAIHCWVRDTGKGIPEERLAKVFDKLETDPHKAGGSGLGLAIVKQVIEAQGGHITVASKVGEGTTFTFILPLEDTSGMPEMGNGTAA